MSLSKEIKVAILEAKLKDHQASLFSSQAEVNLCVLRGLDTQAEELALECAGFVKTVSWLESELSAIESEGDDPMSETSVHAALGSGRE